jgi:nucleoid DNA-binding protein
MVKLLMQEYGFTVAKSKGIVDLFVTAMADALAEGKAVEFRGFGYMKLGNFKGDKYAKKIRFKTHPRMLERINGTDTIEPPSAPEE